MDGAFRTLDYDGVFSYYAASHSAQVDLVEERGPGQGQVRALRTGSRTTAKLATFRIVHVVIDGIERERIVHLNGPRREILRTGDEVAYLLTPGDALLDLEGATPGGAYGRVFARRFENVADHYDVVVKGRDRVAGRPATHLQVTPLDEDRLGYQLWLDDASGLLLRSELRDPSRTNLEIFQFTSLLVGEDVDPENLVSTTQGALIRQLSITADDAARTDSPWRAGWVPAGFELTSANTGDNPPGLSMLTFSDGLAAFSVFVEAMPETGAGHVVSAERCHGRLDPHGRQRAWQPPRYRRRGSARRHGTPHRRQRRSQVQRTLRGAVPATRPTRPGARLDGAPTSATAIRPRAQANPGRPHTSMGRGHARHPPT